MLAPAAADRSVRQSTIIFLTVAGVCPAVGYTDKPLCHTRTAWPDAQLAVCPALDAALVLACYPPADESARDGFLGRGRGVRGAVWLFPRRTPVDAHAGCGTDKGSYLAYALSVVRGLGVPVTEQLE